MKRKERKKRGPLLTTRQFAERIGVSIKQVQFYVRRGLLDGDAIQRTDAGVRIRPAVAKRQLALRLSPAVRGRAITGGASLAAGAEALNVALKKELVKNIRLKNAVNDRTERGRAGRYMLAAEIDGLLKRTVGETLDAIERQMPGFITNVARGLGVPRDKLAALANERMAKVRAEASAIREPRAGNGKGH